MSVDLEKLALRRLLENQNTQFYNKLSKDYFNGVNKLLFEDIQEFYNKQLKLPTVLEFSLTQKQEYYKEYINNDLISEKNSDIEGLENSFLCEQLEDAFIRDSTLSYISTLLDDISNFSKNEIVDSLQSCVLNLHKNLPTSDELFNIATLPTVPSQDDFILYPSGLSNQFDAVNGGLATQELILLGGRRGSGKSIIAQNIALYRFLLGTTVSFFSIEMRYKEVYFRLMSMLTGIPFLKFMLGQLTLEEKIIAAEVKLNTFYQKNDEMMEVQENLIKSGDVKQFDSILASKKLKFKLNQFLLIDDVNLSIAKIDSYLNNFKKMYNITMCVVDYLNIIKTDNRMDWQSQIVLADSLKLLARKYDVTMVSPYQIDATGEARFAKGILDSADKSFRFIPTDLTDRPNVIPFETAKIRNGKAMKFEVPINWECLKIDPTIQLGADHGKILNKYGDDRKGEESREI